MARVIRILGSTAGGLLLAQMLALLLASIFTGSAQAQGLIFDRRVEIRPIEPCEVRELSVDATIRDQVATVQVTQLFHNPSRIALEAELLFPLPEDGTIQNFVLMVDGREIPGRILAREEARRIYEEIVRARRDPALLEFVGRGMYRTSVFPVPAGADRKVTMRYTHVLPRENATVTFEYPLAAQRMTSRSMPRLEVSLRIDSREAIKSIYSPSHDVKVDRSGDHEARVYFNQRDASVASDFRLLYTLEAGPVGATVLTWRPDRSNGDQDGYFMLLASPEVKAADARPLPKTVIFVLDRSGSMAGKKIEQARNALNFVLDNLKNDDLFNIIAYDDRIESFKPELQRYTRETRDEARRFIDNIRAGGSTNIDEALHTALGMIQEDSRPDYVIFLTDGLPTTGERNETVIADHVKKDNRYHARVFTFGVGFDVNARLLDRLSGGNAGSTEFVKPDEDLEAKVANFYNKMASPVMTNIRLTMDGVDLNRVYPRDLPDLFAGGQLVVVGRYSQSKNTTVRLTGKVGSREQTIESRVNLASRGDGRRYDYIERIWAARRIGNLLDEIDMRGRNSELVDELIGLSKRYGILTPYTSFLADERTPNVDYYSYNYDPRRGTVSSGDVSRMKGEALSNLGAMDRVGGESGMDQRMLKSQIIGGAQAMPAQIYGPGGTGGGGGAGGRGGSAMGGRRGGAGAGADAAKPLESGISEARTGSGGRGRAAGAVTAPAPASGPAVLGEAVQQVGTKTFYRRQGVWVDSTVDEASLKSATQLTQFSDAYNKLIAELPADAVQYLAFREPVAVRLTGKVYQINPPLKP